MHNNLWKNACAMLRTMNPDLFSRWFAPIHCLGLQDGILQLGVANEFSRIWLQDNFLPLLREVVGKVAHEPVEIKLLVANLPATHKVPATAPVVDELPATAKGEKTNLPADVRLNSRYTFESFVIGPNNYHAHAAALAVAQAPAKAYNPLFVYGGVGLGKTHLMQAIGHYVADHGHARRVCYTSCEEFINDFIQAIQANSLMRFRKKYRQTDVLLIDDVQFLAGKERMQEEFFHTFNSLFDSHKQIVLSSDRPAAEIANLEARLVSRFEWGLSVDLQPPALETRIAILRNKAAGLKITLPDSVILFLAEKIKTNIRRLEGALVRVASFGAFTGKDLTVEAVESLLRDVLHEEARKTVTVDLIQKKVAEHFDIRLADMTSRRRPQNVAFPRQVAMYLSRTMTDKSLVDIGESFGGRDHGTVLHACRVIDKRLGTEPRLRQAVSYLQDALQREQRA